jgi:steroid delta-isomerase-like uncharacterized protein
MDSEFFVRMFDAWNRHDADALVEYLTNDCTYTDMGLEESNTGRAAIRRYIARLDKEFSSDYTMDRGFALLSRAGYAVEWVMKGTHDLSGPKLPATGKRYEIHGVSVGELREGKVVRNTDYWNREAFLRQIGLMPPPEVVQRALVNVASG